MVVEGCRSSRAVVEVEECRRRAVVEACKGRAVAEVAGEVELLSKACSRVLLTLWTELGMLLKQHQG